mgnify:CR=1 FL=1
MNYESQLNFVSNDKENFKSKYELNNHNDYLSANNQNPNLEFLQKINLLDIQANSEQLNYANSNFLGTDKSNIFIDNVSII